MHEIQIKTITFLVNKIVKVQKVQKILSHYLKYLAISTAMSLLLFPM
jgi:hypothetical protein